MTQYSKISELLQAISLPINPDKLYSVNESLEILDIGRTKFYADLQANKITAIKVGNRTKVRGKALLNYQYECPAYQPKGGQTNA